MLTAILPLVTLLAPSRAADVTEMPPMLRGDLEIKYDLTAENARLMEGDEKVGTRQRADHQLTYAGTFSFFKGLGLSFAIPHTVSETVRYGEARQMVVDSDFGSGGEVGTMLNGAPLSPPPEVSGSGLGGTWFGLRGAPFSSELFPHRRDRSTWLLEIAYRFKDTSNFWTTNDSNHRGGGAGAPAFKFHGAWSSQYGSSQPYITTTLIRTSRITTDVKDESGATVATGLTLRPASTADIGVGTELLAGTYGEGESQGQVAIDFRLHFGYRSWQDIPSGVYLPSVLDMTRSLAINESEYAYVLGGLGFNWRIVEYVQLNLGGDIGTSSPHRIEHTYPISTGLGTIDWQVHSELRFRARDPLFD